MTSNGSIFSTLQKTLKLTQRKTRKERSVTAVGGTEKGAAAGHVEKPASSGPDTLATRGKLQQLSELQLPPLRESDLLIPKGLL